MGFVKKEIDLDEVGWKDGFCFECLGVKICFRSNSKDFVRRLRKKMPEIVPILWRETGETESVHNFSVVVSRNPGKEYRLYKGSDFVLAQLSVEELLNYLETQIRSIIAEFAEDLVFLHAGVVSWQGRGIVIPGKTFAGKTTLVSELIKRDCEYLSDEYALIDKNGYVHPFPKKLSVRGIIDEYRQVDLAAADFGGKPSLEPVPVRYLLVTEYKKEARKPRIKVDTAGEGVMIGVANSISIRQNPKFVLEVLSVVAGNALILKSKRGEAGEFADYLLSYLEKMEKLNGAAESDRSLAVNI